MIEPQSLTPVPRAARMKEGYRDARRAWAVAAAVAGVVLLTWLLLENARWQRLGRYGVVVQGRVAGRRQTTGKGATDYLTVDFPAAGTTRAEEFSVPESMFDRYADGDAIRVRVDPEDATNTSVYHFDAEAANRLLLLWGGAWLVGGMLVALAFRADADIVRLQRRRLEGWDLGWMEVDRVLAAEAKQTGLYLSGHYVDAEGRTRTVSKLHLPTGFQVRETIPILFDPLSDGVVALASLDKVELAQKASPSPSPAPFAGP